MEKAQLGSKAKPGHLGGYKAEAEKAGKRKSGAWTVSGSGIHLGGICALFCSGLAVER